MEPTEIEAKAGASALTITWSDGVVHRLSHRLLRGYCPCAHCQGHQGPVRFVEPPTVAAALVIADLHEVGNYALRLVWGDAHSTGLYRYTFLRELGDASGHTEVETLRFAR